MLIPKGERKGFHLYGLTQNIQGIRLQHKTTNGEYGNLIVSLIKTEQRTMTEVEE